MRNRKREVGEAIASEMFEPIAIKTRTWFLVTRSPDFWVVVSVVAAVVIGITWGAL